MRLFPFTSLAIALLLAGSAGAHASEAEAELTFSADVPAILRLSADGGAGQFRPMHIEFDDQGFNNNSTTMRVISDVRGAPIAFRLASDPEMIHASFPNKTIPFTVTLWADHVGFRALEKRKAMEMSYEELRIGVNARDANPHQSQTLYLTVMPDIQAYRSAIAGRYATTLKITATHGSAAL